MSETVTGPFEVKRVAQDVHDAMTGLLARHSLDKVYSGDLSGTGKGEMLSAGTPVGGSAGYVAIERVDGTLRGRKGSFYLQHNGTLTRGVGTLVISVIPDSATEELTGLSGQMQILVADGAHNYVFDYDLAD